MWKGIRVNWVRWKKMFGQNLHVLFGSVGISRDRTMKGESGPHSNRVLCTPNHFKLFIKPPPEPKPFHHLFMNFTINNSWWKIKQTCQAKRNSIMIKKESICFLCQYLFWNTSIDFSVLVFFVIVISIQTPIGHWGAMQTLTLHRFISMYMIRL